MIYFERATRRHCMDVAENLRDSDRAELEASYGDQLLAILRGWLGSVYCFAGVDENGTTLGIFGAFRTDDYWWSPWMLGTKELEKPKNKRALARLSVTLFPKFAARFGNMRNYVAARNTESIKWLKQLGFTIHEAEPYGIQNLPFCKFEMQLGSDEKCVIR